MKHGETEFYSGVEKPPLQPHTLKGHRHSIVGQRLSEYDIDVVLDVGGSTYLENGYGGVSVNADALIPLGIDLSGSEPPGLRYLSANIMDDYDSTRRPDVFYDGLSLPFRTGGVSAVTAIDVLEHISPSHRHDFTMELGRVAGKRLLVLFPFDSEANRDFEIGLMDDLTRNDIPPRSSLVEHRELGLPTVWDIHEILANSGYTYHTSYHSPLDILVPYHKSQTAVLLAYNRGEIDAEEAVKYLKQLQIKTMQTIEADEREINPENAYRVLIDVDIEKSEVEIRTRGSGL